MDQPIPAAEYEIGYKKPPRKTQFAKGQSGNPRGRPKRPEAVSHHRALERRATRPNGEVTTRREALVIKLLNDAMNGKQRAFARFVKLMIALACWKRKFRLREDVSFSSERPAMSPSPDLHGSVTGKKEGMMKPTKSAPESLRCRIWQAAQGQPVSQGNQAIQRDASGRTKTSSPFSSVTRPSGSRSTLTECEDASPWRKPSF